MPDAPEKPASWAEGLQFVWWGLPEWRPLFAFWRYEHSWRLIYRWGVRFGPLEIRRWTPWPEMKSLLAKRNAEPESSDEIEVPHEAE